MDTLTAIPALAPYAGYISAAIGIAAIVARFLPPPAMPASGFYPIVYGVMNMLAMNAGHARNATDPTAPAPVAATTGVTTP